MQKTVHGILLEQRTCTCPCQKPFWVTPKSIQKVYSKFCEGKFIWANGTESTCKVKKRAGRVKFVPPAGLISARKLADVLEVSYQTIFFWLRQGIIVSERMGKHHCFDLNLVRSTLQRRANDMPAMQAGSVYRP